MVNNIVHLLISVIGCSTGLPTARTDMASKSEEEKDDF
jgi:hypothetical protein